MKKDSKIQKEKKPAVYVDDFGSKSKPEMITEDELNRRNQAICDQGLDEYGYWMFLK